MNYKTKRDYCIRVKNSKGLYTSVVRERYLTDDIPCRSNLCSSCIQDDGLLLLTKSVTHYIIPDCQAALQYFDIFEFEQVAGLIFLQTCVEYVKSKVGRRQEKRFKQLLQNARQDCVVFNNEFHKQCYSDRWNGETNEEWKARLVYEAAVWYYDHLDGERPVVIISDSHKVLQQYSEKMLNIFVMSMSDYLKMFLGNYPNIHEAYESLSANLKDESTSGGAIGETIKEYKDYLPTYILETQVKLGHFIQGTLRVNKYNPKEAYVTLSENLSKENEKLSDILVPSPGMRNRAIHGDHVVVEILKTQEKSNGRAENSSKTSDLIGRVVGVLQRNWRDYVACFDEEESKTPGKRSGKVLVVPYDYRIPKIRISTTQIEKLKTDRIVVRIDNWKTNSLYPCGHFLRSLGPIGDLKTECSVILVEHSLLTLPFTETQLNEMPINNPDNPWRIEENEILKRRDLRNTHLIFSIDPKGCEDVDDTLSVKELRNGDIELGVHIADVTHFVKSNSFTDLEARARSTTVYLADRRYDMLPAILSSDLCSLLSNVDRYAVSVLWTLDKTYEVKDVWYGKTIVSSKYKLFYEIAQVISEGNINNKDIVQDIPELQRCKTEDELNLRLEELRWAIVKLMDIARNLKSKRTKQGALDLEGVEVQVQLDEKKEIEDLVPKQPLEVHETIAECMIFANHWVAKRILKSFPACSLLRRHPLPRQDHFTNVINCAKSKGFDIDTSSNLCLASSLDSCIDPNDETFNKVVRSLTTQAMSNALYFSTGAVSQDQFFHYGLALDRYTHFTSPIRRYADVIVHRQLMMAIGHDDRHEATFSNQELQEVATNMNTKHRESQNAQRDSVQLFQTLYFRDLDENDERRFAEGVIYQTRENGVLVVVERYGLKGPVYLKDTEGQVVSPSSSGGVEYVPGSLTKDEFEVTVCNSCGTFNFRLFDHVKVYIGVSQSRAHGNSIKLKLASCYPYKLSKCCSMTKEDIKLQKKQLVQDVKDYNADIVKFSIQDETDGNELSQLRTMYAQTNKDVSLYCLLNHLKELSLQE